MKPRTGSKTPIRMRGVKMMTGRLRKAPQRKGHR